LLNLVFFFYIGATEMAKLLTDTIVTFQGGGIYDDNGQLISAGKLDDGNYIFVDTSRNIDGIIKPSKYPHDMIREIKHRYLHNEYINVFDTEGKYRNALCTLQNWKG